MVLWNLIEKIVKFIVEKILHIKLSDEKWEAFFQFVKFGIVGLSNTIISYVLYVGSLLLFRTYNILPKYDYLLSQVIGFVISVLWSFYWNRKKVFKADDSVPVFQALIKTFISYAFTGLFLNAILAVLWVEYLHISKIIAPIINLLISVPLNFILNKFWAFKKKK